MIIDDFDIESVALMPFKADSPLLVDADGILPFPFASQSVKHVSWIQHQGLQARGGMEHHQSLSCLPFEGLETSNASVVKEFFGIPTGKGLDHTGRILRLS